MADRWWEAERDIDHPDWQSGVTNVIEGVRHIYGCVRDRCCFNDGVLTCDCPCHNGERLPWTSP